MQTYVPYDQSWFEQEFNYRIEIKVPVDDVAAYFRVKDWLLSDPDRWGVYREDWFFHAITEPNGQADYRFYFMCKDRAMWFRLSVDL